MSKKKSLVGKWVQTKVEQQPFFSIGDVGKVLAHDVAGILVQFALQGKQNRDGQWWVGAGESDIKVIA